MTTFKFQFGSAAVAITTLILLSVPAARGQGADDFLRSLITQSLILRSVGDRQEVKLKKSQLQNLSSSCDIAVVVQEAVWNQGKAGLLLEHVGMPYLPGQQRGSCRMIYSTTLLQISGFARDEAPDSLRASLSQILMTPEQYLASRGVSFDLPAGPDDEIAVKVSPGTQPARPVLTVDPNYSEEARRAKYQGTLELNVVIGTDGRLHRVRVVRRLGKGLDEMALKAMPLWRFEPARQQDKPVATETPIEVSFRLY